jgi:hypothetical protein
MKLRAALLAAGLLLTAATAVSAQMNDSNSMPAEKPAIGPATRQAYTTNRAFLVKLISIPQPIPYQKYFRVRLAVYDGMMTSQKIANAKVAVYAGMRHGMTTGFEHGMQSAPKVLAQNGVVTVSGMYFHMMGPWTLQTTVHSGGKSGIAYFQLPCCAQ